MSKTALNEALADLGFNRCLENDKSTERISSL